MEIRGVESEPSSTTTPAGLAARLSTRRTPCGTWPSGSRAACAPRRCEDLWLCAGASSTGRQRTLDRPVGALTNRLTETAPVPQWSLRDRVRQFHLPRSVEPGDRWGSFISPASGARGTIARLPYDLPE